MVRAVADAAVYAYRERGDLDPMMNLIEKGAVVPVFEAATRSLFKK